MTWKKLLGGHDVQPHRTSKKELDDMRALVARDLADATVVGLSADRRSELDPVWWTVSLS